MIFMLYILPKRMECQYRIDKEGRTVFYPFSFKQGYILDDPNIIKRISSQLVWKKIAKALLVNCETTDVPLSKETVRQNIARNSTWAELWALFLITTFIAVQFFLSKLYILAIVCFVLVSPHIGILWLKRKLENKDKNDNINS